MFPAFSLPFLPLIMSREPWNKDRQVGARKALSPSEVGKIRRHLASEKSSHDLCLFVVAVDTMLRASDLLRLRVADVCAPNGKVFASFPWKQKKTGQGVHPVLTPTSQAVLKKWIEESSKQPSDYLFTREKPRTSASITVGFYRTLIKQWVKAIGLHRHDYSAHSLRRSKAIYMYQSGVRIEIISRLLGHTSPASTLHYLGIDQAEAQSHALAHDIFKTKRSDKSATELSDAELDALADHLWERLATRLNDFFLNTEPNK